MSRLVHHFSLCIPGICVLALLIAGCDRRDSDNDGDADKKPKSAATKTSTEKSEEVTLSPDSIRRYGVVVAPARKQVLVETFAAPARVAFDQSAMAQVTSIVPGRVLELKAQLGDRVKPGDELAVIESTELGAAQSDFVEKRVAASGANAAVEPLKAAAERAQALRKSQGITLAEVQKREAEYTAARAAARTAEAVATAAESRLRLLGMDSAAIDQLADSGRIQPRHPVLATCSGQIVQRDVVPGQIVNPDKDTLFIVADLSRLWVLADVPEPRLKDISIGGEAKVTAAGETVAGRVALISPSIDPSTQTAQVRIEIREAPAAIKPGMFATAHLAQSTARAGAPVLAVPEEAVQMIEGKPTVFVADDEPNTYRKRDIAVGPAVGGWVPVLSGLKENDPVVIAGTFILKAELVKPGDED